MKHTLITHPHSDQVQITSSLGNYYIDDKGNKILDMESGIWCASLGHNHPEILEVIKDQYKSLSHIGKRLLPESIDEVSKKLLEISKMNGKCMFLNTGSEAIELSIMLASESLSSPKIIGLKNNYVTAFGKGSSYDITIDIDPYLKNANNNSDYKAIRDQIEEGSIFIFDPFCFSRQILIPPKEVIETIVREVQKKNGIVIIDEITTGMGRCGKWFGFHYFDIEPDLVVLGKSIGNGYPVSAILTNKLMAAKIELADFMHYQSHQNDPLGYFIAAKVVDIIEKQDLLSEIAEKASYLRELFKQHIDPLKIVKEVRSIGLMTGVQIDNSVDVVKIFNNMLLKNIFVGASSGTNTINLFPPYTITKEEINNCCKTLKECLESYG